MPKDTLLWLFAHGAAVWQASLALLVIAGLAVAARRARRRAATPAGAVRARLGRPLAAGTPLREGMAATLAGRLEARGASGERLDGAGAAAMDVAYHATGIGADSTWETMAEARAPRLVLLVGEERVEIVGRVEIVLGSRAPSRLPSAVQVPAPLRDGLGAWQHHFGSIALHLRELGSGDEVWAAGVIQRETAEAVGAYRDRPIRWRLVPTEAAPPGAGARPVALAFAGTPRPVSRLPGLVSHALHAAAGGLVFLAVFGLGGRLAFDRLEALRSLNAWIVAPELETDEAMEMAAIVAVSPFRHAMAEGWLTWALDRHRGGDGKRMDVLATLRASQGAGEEAAALWIGYGHLERGAAQADASGLDELAARAWYVAGDFERASLAWARASAAVKRWDPLEKQRRIFGVRVHLLAGRSALAAAEARTLGEVIEEHGQSYVGHFPMDHAGGARCLADTLDARRGDRAARERLEHDPPWSSYMACSALFFDLLAGPERLAAMDARRALTTRLGDPLSRLVALLAAEADPESREVPPATMFKDAGELVNNPAAALGVTEPAIERALADALIEARRTDPLALRSRARAATSAATLASIAGDHDAARRYAAEARAAALALPADGVPADLDPRRVAALEAALALDESNPSFFAAREAAPISPFIAASLVARERGDYAPVVTAANLFGMSRRDEILQIGPDGGRLLRAIQRDDARDPDSGSEPPDPYRALRLLAPSIHRGQEDLLRWIRWGRRDPAWRCSVGCQLVAWMDLARSAQTLGDAGLARELRERAARFATALRRREIAVPLAVLDQL